MPQIIDQYVDVPVHQQVQVPLDDPDPFSLLLCDTVDLGDERRILLRSVACFCCRSGAALPLKLACRLHVHIAT